LIAKRLGFPDEFAMSHFVRRLTGASPSLLRSEGAMRRTLELSTRTHV
jgi:AraC-like DNA-binding protein